KIFFIFTIFLWIFFLSLQPLKGHSSLSNPEYVFVNKSMNWSSAQQYCRQNFKDLATVRNETDWQKIYVKTDSQNSWIGLYRDSNIFWSDGSSFSFNKTRFSLLLWPNYAQCGFYYKPDTAGWRFESCTYAYAFVCYTKNHKLIF
uniref:C-type lectin domain-containing protein n=1 Tax=Oryzias latipes TaxID=8090 RepID=A0A3P9MCP8_ORYLA